MSDEDEVTFGEMSDDDFEQALASVRPAFLDDFHFRELVDLRSYCLHQDHMVNDLSFKLNNRKGKLRKKLKKGSVYGLV